MTEHGGFDDTLLDDVERMSSLDSPGLLRASAMAGAQVRSTAEDIAALDRSQLASGRPRAVILVRRPSSPRAYSPLISALVGQDCPVPMVTSTRLPAWIGPLDMVVAHTADPGDVQLAEDLTMAVRHGATVVLAAPEDGPVAAAAAGRVLHVRPRVPGPASLELPRVLTVCLLLLTELGLFGGDTDALADELDREAQRCHPAHESLVNPAKSLAMRLAERLPLLWGADPIAAAVAVHAQQTLAAHAGVVAHAASLAEAAMLPALYQKAVQAGSDASIFYDSYEEGDPPGGWGPRAVLLGVDQAAAHDAAQWLPSADVATVDEELVVPATGMARSAYAAAVLALRFDMASLYLGIATGALGGGGGLVAPAAG